MRLDEAELKRMEELAKYLLSRNRGVTADRLCLFVPAAIEEIRRLRKALKFYHHPYNYEPNIFSGGRYSSIYLDNGKTAREALEGE